MNKTLEVVSLILLVVVCLLSGCKRMTLKADPDESEVIRKIASFSNDSVEVRRNAVASLVKMGSPAVEHLTAALGDEDDLVRWHAAETLGKIGDERAVDPLISMLKDENSSISRSAVKALADIGGPAVAPLIAALQDEDPLVRWNANEALTAIGDTAVEPLILALKYNDLQVRRNAAKALSHIRDKRAVTPFINALKDEDGIVRWNAAKALGEMGDERAVAPLTSLLQDDNMLVREVAAEAIEAIERIRSGLH